MAEQTGERTRERYDAALANEIEERWQRAWEEAGAFEQPNPGGKGFEATRPKYYVLDMFPYPSGAGLHVGHPEGYTATDILARYKRMRGFNVLHPMGWDAFGLPAEQYAIQTGVHPAETTRAAIDNFRRQLRRFGFSYDWSREVATIDPGYYRWTQWIFLRLYDSWFDPEAAQREGRGRGRARPISELVEELERDRRRVGAGGRTVPTGHRLFDAGEAWETLSDDERRGVIDGHRLAYLGEQTVNWCPKLGTALANEEVIDGRSERGGYRVFRKPLRQWMLRITAYAERLLEGLEDVDWPQSTRTMQAQWIGRSEGAEVVFALKVSDLRSQISDTGSQPSDAGSGGAPGVSELRVFTTRPDTIFGATFMVVAPEHPLVEQVLHEPAEETDVERLRGYVEQARNRSDVERQEAKEKSGVFAGVYAQNPATGKPIPVWVADYVLMGYGTGAIMAVPGQDDRDWEFAEKFDLPIVRTVRPPEGFDGKAYTGDGPAVNSAFLDGLHVDDAKAKIVDWLEERGLGERRINYRLRDWLFSRQRYWGEPFPIVFDERGRHFAVHECKLPVELPPLEDFAPEESDDPKPLLAKAEGWVKTTAGEAGVRELPPEAVVYRETNTMPGWAGSCWYYLRYCDPQNDERFVGEEAERYWVGARERESETAREGGTEGGVDLYIGGAEHAVLHLLYARFWHKVLFDLGHVSSDEPFRKLFHQGLITSFAFKDSTGRTVPVDEVEERGEGEFYLTATGERVEQIVAKMSKTLKNVINPDDVIAEFGADTFRLYEMYMGPLEASKPWNTRDISGLMRFCQRIWRLVVDEETGDTHVAEAPDGEIEKLLHRTVAKVQGDLERLSFNTAIAAMIEFVNAATATREKGGAGLTREQALRFCRMLSPFAPHLAEELWSRLRGEGLVCQAAWPGYDEAMLVDDTIELPVQIRGKVRARISVAADADAAAVERAALEDPKVREMLGDAPPRKVIVVPGRMVNIVPG